MRRQYRKYAVWGACIRGADHTRRGDGRIHRGRGAVPGAGDDDDRDHVTTGGTTVVTTITTTTPDTSSTDTSSTDTTSTDTTSTDTTLYGQRRRGGGNAPAATPTKAEPKFTG